MQDRGASSSAPGNGIVLKVTAADFCRDLALMPAYSVEPPPSRRTSESGALCASEVDLCPMPQLSRLGSGATRGMGLARLGIDCLQRIVSGPELLLSTVKEWLKNDPDRRVALIDADSGASDEIWCCKESVSRRWWVRYITRFGWVRAWNAFHQGLMLRQLDISTPQPLAVVTVERSRAVYEYLLTVAVPGAVSLQKWLACHGSDIPAEDWFDRRQQVARQLGLQLQRLHQHGFDHRDLKPSNILLDERDCLYLIDLDGIWRWPRLPQIRRVQNLARLWAGLAGSSPVAKTDALRFLFAYLTPEQRDEWKRLWRYVARRASRKIKQKVG